MTDLVVVERFGKVLRITLNKPKVNAISRAMSRAIFNAAKTLQEDDSLRVGVITANGDRVFSAGWDFSEAASGNSEIDDNLGHGEGGFGGITRYWGLTKPVICAVNGAAVGGGFEIALAADIILMSDSAYFQLPELQRGFLPDAGGVQRLPRRLPYNVAIDMILSGRRMDAEEAVRWGLAAQVIPLARLQDEALAKAAAVAESAPLALQALKEVMRGIDGLPLRESMNLFNAKHGDFPIFASMWASEDAVEGPRAFLEKRPPQWKGM